MENLHSTVLFFFLAPAYPEEQRERQR